MTPWFASVLLFAVAALGFLALGSVLAAILALSVRSQLKLWQPRSRHAALLSIAVMPAACSFWLLLCASAPAFIALLVPELDHCALHADDHAHLCFKHLPQGAVHGQVLLALIGVASYVFVRAAIAARSGMRALRVLRALSRTAQQRSDVAASIVDAAQPMCFTAGFLRPRVFVSRGLLETLNAAELGIVLLHEQAHVRRADALCSALARACAGLHLPRVRHWLLRELQLSAEQACDEEAALAVHDRLAVASAILRVERIAQGAPATHGLGMMAVAFGESAVEQRVCAMLDDPRQNSQLKLWSALGSAVAICGLVASGPLHHVTESLVSALAL